MSIEIDENTTSTCLELQAPHKMIKGENGSVHDGSYLGCPKMSPHTKPKRRTKWDSVRNVIKVTSVVKNPKKKGSVTRQDSFLKRFSTRQHYKTESEDSPDSEDDSPGVVYVHNDITVFKPDGTQMFYWLFIVTIAVLYNLWTCIVRQAFKELQEEHKIMWITLDVVSDVVYILDIVAQLRTGYLEQGLMVLDAVKLAKKYIRSVYFKVDLISLLPLDFLQFAVGWQPLLRFPRFLRVYRALRFLYMLETRTAYPNFVRVANLTHLLFLGCHWFAAFYFMISEAEGFHSEWSYPEPSGSFKSLTRKYLASLFWSTLTLTTIGDLPPPETNWEYVFVIGSYLIGVFIFATIVGQVGNVITNRNASRLEFERLLIRNKIVYLLLKLNLQNLFQDGAKLYMRMHNVPPPVQRRVQRWYDYVWTRGRMTGSDINSLGLLPDKLKTELAIHVNLETLKKVTIFNECQPEFLHDLVLKMKAYIFTPGDLICRRGEVAREMFIIADGVVEIISESGSILTQMSTGNFFGEIGILNLDGGINRRTADVKSVGYSELFVLSREDVLEALKDHPDAKEIIRKYAEQRLKQVLQDRKKLHASKATNDSTINQLLIGPRRSIFSRGRRKSSNISIKSQKSTGKLGTIFGRRKSHKSKYRVGTYSHPVISVSDHSDSGTCMFDTHNDACVASDEDEVISANKPVSKSLTSLSLLNNVHRHVEAGTIDYAGRFCQTSIKDTNHLDVCSNTDIGGNISDSGGQFSEQRPVTSRNLNETNLVQTTEDVTSETCCRCGQLERKLYQIEKQLTTVEKLYLEGIKQLETFNEINEQYVKMLNMIPDYPIDDTEKTQKVHIENQVGQVKHTPEVQRKRVSQQQVKCIISAGCANKEKQHVEQDRAEHLPDDTEVRNEKVKFYQVKSQEYIPVKGEPAKTVPTGSIRHINDSKLENDQQLKKETIQQQARKKIGNVKKEQLQDEEDVMEEPTQKVPVKYDEDKSVGLVQSVSTYDKVKIKDNVQNESFQLQEDGQKRVQIQSSSHNGEDNGEYVQTETATTKF